MQSDLCEEMIMLNVFISFVFLFSLVCTVVFKSSAHLHSLQTFYIHSGSGKNKMNVFIGKELDSFPLSLSDV